MPERKPFDPKNVFRNPIQIGILVDDLDKYLDNFNKILGMSPWQVSSFPPDNNKNVIPGIPWRTIGF